MTTTMKRGMRIASLVVLGLAAAAAHAQATLSESPASAVAGTSVTATWSGIATPSTTDWITLALPSAPNTSFVTYRYTTGTASGSVPFTIPISTAGGTYELRLFANGGYTRLATSATFTITPAMMTLSGTVTWSGAPLSGVVFAVGSGSCTTSDASGAYSCSVPYGYTGTVTPSLARYTFTPAARSYSNVTANQSAQSYTATHVPLVISGTVSASGAPLPWVGFTASNGGSCTASNPSGQYSCSVPYGYSGTVTPSRAGYDILPASRSYTSLADDVPAQDYAATQITFGLSGSVTAGGAPLAGVAFVAAQGASCSASDASGAYSCTLPMGYTGAVTPHLAGYVFVPASRSYDNVVAAQSGQDFTGQVSTATAGIYYIHADHLNTPRLVADGTGTAVWRWDQTEAFGDAPPNDNPSGLGAFPFQLRFPGQYADRETGLFYNYFRDYDAVTGRYGKADPLGLLASLNLYAYVSGNPIRNTDPRGLMLAPGHNVLTQDGALAAGMSAREAETWAVLVVNVDFDPTFAGAQSPSRSLEHAMCGPQVRTPEEFAQCMEKYRQKIRDWTSTCNPSDWAHALHASQDWYAGGHGGRAMRDQLFQGWSHLWNDLFPSSQAWGSALAVTQALLERWKWQCQCSYAQ